MIKQAIILVGGRGTRLSEQTGIIPKPLVQVGGKPILFHIINHLVRAGVEKVVLAGGYKVDSIRQALISELQCYTGDIAIDPDGSVKGLKDGSFILPCNIVVADTGLDTGTAQRIKMAGKYLDQGDFFLLYGDNVSDVKMSEVEAALEADPIRLIALTAVQFCERFGIILFDEERNNQLTRFAEKSISSTEFINGGFMACRAEVLDMINPEDEDFSRSTLPRLTAQGKIGAHLHKGFWYAMDTQRDYEKLNEIYKETPELFL